MPPNYVAATDPRRTKPPQWNSYNWTEERIKLVRTLHRRNVPLTDIAKTLGIAKATVKRKFPKTEFLGRAAGENRKALAQCHVNIAATMAAYGVPRSEIARALSIGPPRLEREAGKAMDLAVALTNCKVAGFLLKSAQQGSVPAQIYWLKSRGGPEWKETHHVTLEGQVGVLVAPGGVEPGAWIEAESARSATMAPGAAETGGKLKPGEVVVRRQLGRAEDAVDGEDGAAAPWNADERSEAIVALGVELADLGSVGVAEDLGGGDWDEASLEDMLA